MKHSRFESRHEDEYNYNEKISNNSRIQSYHFTHIRLDFTHIRLDEYVAYSTASAQKQHKNNRICYSRRRSHTYIHHGESVTTSSPFHLPCQQNPLGSPPPQLSIFGKNKIRSPKKSIRIQYESKRSSYISDSCYRLDHTALVQFRNKLQSFQSLRIKRFFFEK